MIMDADIGDWFMEGVKQIERVENNNIAMDYLIHDDIEAIFNEAVF